MESAKILLKKYNLRAIKKFGQNFLIDNNIINKITNINAFDNTDGILEIGAGLGHLTNELIKKTQSVVTVEIDKRLVAILTMELGANSNLKIINADFLKLDLKQLVATHFATNQNIHLVANLPYYITSQIVCKLLANIELFTSFTLTMQKEVAQRFCAKPKTKIYNNLSIMCQFYCDIKILFDINANSFIPIPNVTSSVVYFKVNPKLQLLEPKLFWIFVRSCFISKRKTLVNNLAVYLKNKQQAVNIINDLNWKSTIRSEELTFAMFYELFNFVNNN